MASYQAQDQHFTKRSWTGAAFIVESLLLLAFMAGTLAVLLNIFAQSYTVGSQSQDKALAIVAATNTAETFAAAPEEGLFISPEGDFVTNCVVEAEKTSSGTMYYAHIAVYSLSDIEVHDNTLEAMRDYFLVHYDSLVPVYELDTARFVSGEVS